MMPDTQDRPLRAPRDNGWRHHGHAYRLEARATNRAPCTAPRSRSARDADNA